MALVMSMGIMAWADGETGGEAGGEGGSEEVNTPTSCSITINPNKDTGTVSTEYTYYELLKASINGTAVSYYLPSPAGDTLKGLLDAVTVSGADLFTFTKSADGTRWIATINEKSAGVAFADSDGEAIAAALNTDAIKAAALATNTFSQSGGSAVAEGLDAGYYLITSTLGTKLVLQTLGDVEIETKNEYHTSTKTASKTNMNIGDTVTYTITVHIPATAKVGDEVTVHDTLDEHLQADLTTLKAKVGETDVTLSDGTKKAETETFAKKFAVTEAMLNADVVITYDATLLSTAADDTGYVNELFSNTSAYETVPSKVRVWTFDFDLDKNFQNVTGDDAANYSATFELKNSNDEVIYFTKDGNNYTKTASTTEGAVAILTINGKDNINVKGLEAGTYTLTEKTTAEGYNLLTDAITVTITDTSPENTATDESKTPSHEVSYKIGNGENAKGTVTVENNTGTVLPSTGGIGTTIFYVVGSILVVAAGVLLITKKRMSREG